MAEDQIVGAWRLVSFELRNASGQVTYPFDPDARGYIMYTSEGFMSVAFMSADRPKFHSEDPQGGSPEEKALATDTYFSYCGRYEIKGDKVIHKIEISLFPNWVGADQERTFEFDGNRLTLSTSPFLVQGLQQTAHLVWERA